jgi:hypothetical protein
MWCELMERMKLNMTSRWIPGGENGGGLNANGAFASVLPSILWRG